MKFLTKKLHLGPVRGFSFAQRRITRSISRGVAQPGSATVLGTVGRKFESCRPDHFTTLVSEPVPQGLSVLLSHI